MKIVPNVTFSNSKSIHQVEFGKKSYNKHEQWLEKQEQKAKNEKFKALTPEMKAGIKTSLKQKILELRALFRKSVVNYLANQYKDELVEAAKNRLK